jgi:hypothetical protein
MYLLHVNHHVGLIGLKKFDPHFKYGSSAKIVTSLAKLYVVKPLAHASQDPHNSKAS